MDIYRTSASESDEASRDALNDGTKVDPRIALQWLGALLQTTCEMQVLDQRAHVRDVGDCPPPDVAILVTFTGGQLCPYSVPPCKRGGA